MSQCIAILISDLHFSDRAPVLRSAEPDWYAAQARPINEIRRLQEEHGNPLIVCAGDVFHRWDACPRVVNWANQILPTNLVAIPGQHDLPNHSRERLAESAWWSLFGEMRQHEPDVWRLYKGPRSPAGVEYARGAEWLHRNADVGVCGFPFGSDADEYARVQHRDLGALIFEDDSAWRDVPHIAAIHRYAHTPETRHPGASPEDAFDSPARGGWTAALDHYDIVAIGDNHKPWVGRTPAGTTFFNCGTTIRRTRTDLGMEPRVGLVMRDDEGEVWVQSHLLDTSADVYHGVVVTEDDLGSVRDEAAPEETSQLVEDLSTLSSESSLDFSEAIARETMSGAARALIERGIESD